MKPTNGRSLPVNPLPSFKLYFSRCAITSGLSGSNSSKCDVSAAPSRFGTYGGTATVHRINCMNASHIGVDHSKDEFKGNTFFFLCPRFLCLLFFVQLQVTTFFPWKVSKKFLVQWLERYLYQTRMGRVAIHSEPTFTWWSDSNHCMAWFDFSGSLFSCVCILCFLIYTHKSSITQKYFGTMWDVKNRNFHFSNSQMDWVTVEDPLWRWLLSFCYVLSHPHKYTVKNSLTYSLVNYSTQCHWRTGDKEVPHNPLLTYSQCTILESNPLRFCWLGHPSKTARMSGIIINLETKGWLNIVFTTINTT